MSYAQLYELSSPILKAYRDDLERWDKATIEENPGVPFLHWTRDNGTHLSLLWPPEHYPKRGESVRYLFGTADRRHLVNQCVTIAEYFLKPFSPALLVVYCDGQKPPRVINEELAVEIARTYRHGMDSLWKSEEWRK